MASKAVEPSSSTRSSQANQGTMTVGSFKRLEEIGRGSFATVYKASYSTVLITNVTSFAVLVLSGRLQKQPGYVAIKSVDLKKLNKKLKENLYSEIEILRGLHHPHIVALVSCQETTAHIHLIMEFCELGDLSYFIRKRDTLGQHKTTAEMIRKYPNPPVGGLNEVVVRHFLKQLASALEFLREKDLIHRDVKPQNLLLDPSPEFYAKVSPESVPYAVHEKSFVPATGLSSLPTLKLADFGFARSLPQTSMAETLCGSPLYMAPEILRYEKYDAKADLWSVGTVLHEMLVGKPPFRAANHVELLRKIEKGDDRIRFQEDINISDNMKRLIRSLLRRNPVERSSFEAFFKNPVIQDEIPGLVENDRPTRPSKPEIEESKAEPSGNIQLKQERPRRLSNLEPLSESPRKAESNTQGVQAGSKRPETTLQHRSSGVPDSNAAMQQRKAEQRSDPTRETRERVQQNHRPSIVSHATAPARQDLGIRDTADSPVAVVRRRSNRVSSSPKQSSPLEKTSNRERVLSHQEQKLDREVREARERAAQDVAFERDYVLVEKRAVEVNAFADELAASPRIQGGNQVQQDAHRGAMIRRATTQGSPTSTTGAQNTPSRTMQIASTKRPDQLHHRQSSYDRRYRDATSATSAITKAINLASGRLLNLGFSPPLGLNLGGTSPPSYNPFPAYPTNQGSLLMIGDGSKGQVTMDEDAKMFLLIEEGATRSDVVYCFAEVKYKQLIPLAPSTDRGLGLRQAGIPEGGDGETSTSDDVAMTIDGVVTLAEEALVLYVKALSLLARSMDLANAWWIRKTRGEVIESTSPRTKPSSATTTAAGNRLNNVVQWVRGRFNEVLEKAELVRLKLVESQKQLPSDHPSHPKNQSSQSGSTPAMVKSAENVYITPGVTAEKLMYDRALDMSRSAAVNELVGEDLNGCKIAYETAIRMLEAVLQDDEEAAAAKKVATSEAGAKPSKSEAESVNIVEAEDREVVVKLVSSIRHRLAALKKKSQLIANRNNAVAAATPPAKRSPTPTATPTIASTSPR